MEIDKLTGPELDKAVADAAGIAVHVRILGVGEHEYRMGAVVGETDTPFRPSVDWNDAMLAVDKIKLLTGSFGDAFAIEWRDGEWTAGPKHHDYYDGWMWWHGACGNGDTGPLAICRAILHTKATS